MSSNNIYSYENVSTFLSANGADLVYHGKREWYFRTKLPDLYRNILITTQWLDAAMFIERIYCYTNNISSIPTCLVCSNNTRYSITNKGYSRYCSQGCSLRDVATILGVQNTSQLQTTKDKKRASSLLKYGTESPTQFAELRKLQSEKKTAWWNEAYQYKDFTADGLTRQQYKHRAQQYAFTQYNRYKDILDPTRLRSKEWHVDHVYSMTDGFINDVPINIISDISNLRMLPAADNYKKNKNSHKTLAALYEDFSKSQSAE